MIYNINTGFVLMKCFTFLWKNVRKTGSDRPVSKPRTNYCNKQNKRPLFLPKIKKVFLSPILQIQNLNGKSGLNCHARAHDPNTARKKSVILIPKAKLSSWRSLTGFKPLFWKWSSRRAEKDATKRSNKF